MQLWLYVMYKVLCLELIAAIYFAILCIYLTLACLETATGKLLSLNTLWVIRSVNFLCSFTPEGLPIFSWGLLWRPRCGGRLFCSAAEMRPRARGGPAGLAGVLGTCRTLRAGSGSLPRPHASVEGGPRRWAAIGTAKRITLVSARQMGAATTINNVNPQGQAAEKAEARQDSLLPQPQRDNWEKPRPAPLRATCPCGGAKSALPPRLSNPSPGNSDSRGAGSQPRPPDPPTGEAKDLPVCCVLFPRPAAAPVPRTGLVCSALLLGPGSLQQ